MEKRDAKGLMRENIAFNFRGELNLWFCHQRWNSKALFLTNIKPFILI